MDKILLYSKTFHQSMQNNVQDPNKYCYVWNELSQ